MNSPQQNFPRLPTPSGGGDAAAPFSGRPYSGFDVRGAARNGAAPAGGTASPYASNVSIAKANAVGFGLSQYAGDRVARHPGFDFQRNQLQVGAGTFFRSRRRGEGGPSFGTRYAILIFSL